MCEISVIVPVYNGEKDIEKCISKLMQQTFQDIEIIIVNDGSTDQTEQICKKLRVQDKRIRLYTQKNMGPSVARNKGIELASGEWIVFVDSDDWLETDCLEYVYRVAKEEENTDIVLWNLQEEVNGIPIAYEPFNGEYRLFIEDEIDCFIHTLFTDKTETKDSSLSIKGPYSKLIKSRIARECYFPIELNLGEDVCFAHQIYDKAHKVAYVNKKFYHRIVNENSLSTKIDVELGKKRSTYVNWVLEYRDKYEERLLNEFVFLKYKFVVLYYMNPRLKLPYEIRKQKIEQFLQEVKWKIDFKTLKGYKYTFLLEKKLFGIIYMGYFIKNMLRTVHSNKKD